MDCKKNLNGAKSDYWDILNITVYLFLFLFRTDDKINYKKFRKWFLNNPLYIKSPEADKTMNVFTY